MYKADSLAFKNLQLLIQQKVEGRKILTQGVEFNSHYSLNLFVEVLIPLHNHSLLCIGLSHKMSVKHDVVSGCDKKNV